MVQKHALDRHPQERLATWRKHYSLGALWRVVELGGTR